MHFFLCVRFSSIVTWYWYVCDWELHEWKVDRIQAPASAIISEFEVGATTAIFLAPTHSPSSVVATTTYTGRSGLEFPNSTKK
eukprot:scaffold23561_cov89-Skeletonema_dohrnii-CCMP3373.AAC.1